jgi:hypothetical protein
MNARYDWATVLPQAAEIVRGYSTRVTLRQLFYRLVAAHLLPNIQQSYKALSAKTAEARREGWFPPLLDQGRAILRWPTFESPGDLLNQAASWYRRDRTEGQDWAIYLGVEKSTMTEQLETWFHSRLGIPVLALRGYASQTFVDEVAADVSEDGRPAVLLYAGDFDPSGEDIDRDFDERTRCFDKVVRIALNADQIDEYDLPPAPGKATDARAGAFVARHGQLVQVELEALDPNDLRDLYARAVEDFWDPDVSALVVEREKCERAQVLEVASSFEEDEDQGEDADGDDDEEDR